MTFCFFKKGRRRLAALAWLGLVWPALADERPAPAPNPPACAGRDLALHPEDWASARARRGDELDNGQAIFWRIEKPGVPASYLFGTVHSTDDRAVALAKAAAAHIAAAKVVATELGGPFDAFAKAEMAAVAMAKALTGGDDALAGLGSPADVALVETYLAGRGIGADFAHRVRPWLLAALTAEPVCEMHRQQRGLPVVDELIAQTAKDAGVRVVALETMKEQADVLASVDLATAATVLLDAARRPGDADDAYATLLSLYGQQKPGDVLPALDASQSLTPKERAAEDDFARSLLGGRNGVMFERMRPLLEAGGAFVAVGALHLIGKGGLVALLRANGFSVSALAL